MRRGHTCGRAPATDAAAHPPAAAALAAAALRMTTGPSNRGDLFSPYSARPAASAAAMRERHAAGGSPTARLNARLNAASDS
jgi:hypothetical protein